MFVFLFDFDVLLDCGHHGINLCRVDNEIVYKETVLTDVAFN